MEIKFIAGESIIKQGRKIFAKVYDREEYHKHAGLEKFWSEKYPYSLEIRSMGIRECETLEEVKFFINKYMN